MKPVIELDRGASRITVNVVFSVIVFTLSLHVNKTADNYLCTRFSTKLLTISQSRVNGDISATGYS